MSEPTITFTTTKRFLDYCDGCQQMGNKQVSGVKRHRSLPIDTWLVDITNSHFPDVTNEAVFCPDCLESANKSEHINVIHNDKPLQREDSQMFFMEEDKNGE